MKKKETLLCPTTWLKLKDIMLCKIRQRKTNTVLSHLYVEFKTVQLIKVESRVVVARGSFGWRKSGDVSQGVKTFSYVG